MTTTDAEFSVDCARDTLGFKALLSHSPILLQPKVMSAPQRVFHGDEVQLGGTTLQLHIHPGNETCDGCEPGNVQAELRREQQGAAASECRASVGQFVVSEAGE